MYQTLDVFQTSSAMARHAGRRQAVVAENMANADTPGYRAKRLAPFAETYRGAPAQSLRASRPGHIASAGSSAQLRTGMGAEEPAPNGNAVTLEEEMLAAVEVSREHNRALAIYRKSMEIVRLAIGRR